MEENSGNSMSDRTNKNSTLHADNIVLSPNRGLRYFKSKANVESFEVLGNQSLD